MAAIRNSTAPKRSALDYSIFVSIALLFLLIIILIDAYEYITVPGANHARNHIRTGVNKIHSRMESMAGLAEVMTEDEKEDMAREVEEAKEVVRKKHDEVEEIVEKVEEMEKEVHKPAVAADDASSTVVAEKTEKEKAVEEEKKEEIVEAMVEKELGLENWCGTCRWNKMGFSCDKRVDWMMQQYHLTEVQAKEANIEYCDATKRARV